MRGIKNWKTRIMQPIIISVVLPAYTHLPCKLPEYSPWLSGLKTPNTKYVLNSHNANGNPPAIMNPKLLDRFFRLIILIMLGIENAIRNAPAGYLVIEARPKQRPEAIQPYLLFL